MATGLALVLAASGGASAQVVFEDDFASGSAKAEWSNTSVFTAPSGENLLGRFSNDLVQLSLTGLPAHDTLTLNIRLWIMNTMDGGEPIKIAVNGGAVLLDSTFANFLGGSQFYPNDRGVNPMSPAGTGSLPGANLLQMGAINSLDMGSTGYDLSFTFAHAASDITLDFSGESMQGISDESWGLDNAKVTAIPAPAGVGLLAAAACLGARRRRR